jgi:hypothetical protein
MKRPDLNFTIFLFILLFYLAGQFSIGTWDSANHKFVFNAPADVDFLYYGAIANSLLEHFPPLNPAMSGTPLTQPFLQFYPVAALAKIVNPYTGIRILNIIYLLLFAFVLKRYFPKKYGLALLILFGSSTLMPQINSSGVDFIARGFTHVPSFILLTIAMFGKDIKSRTLSIFTASLLNGYIILIILPYFGIIWLWERKREDLYLGLSALAGLGGAALYINLQVAGRPFYFIFAESLTFRPLEIIKHAAPFIPLIIITKQRRTIVLMLAAVIFGTFIYYNPFFPIFVVYFSGAMMAACGDIKTKKETWAAASILIILVAGFLISCYSKYNPARGDYFPRYDSRLDMGTKWINENTGTQESFMALTADENDLALVIQYRPVYLGYIGHLSHLGLAWEERYEATTRLLEKGEFPPNVDYFFYGPVEQKYFPNAVVPYPAVYRDAYVSIFKLHN